MTDLSEHRANRILWNERDRQTIDEFVIRNPKMVHMEQMDDDHYWMCIDMPDGTSLHVNWWRDKKVIKCVQQECDVAWDEDVTHEDTA